MNMHHYTCATDGRAFLDDNEQFLHRGGGIQPPVAICGMGMRLPGGIRDENSLLEFLTSKRDAQVAVPQSRYNIDGYYNAFLKRGTVATKHGYFLDVDLDQFDLSMFNMTMAEACRLDPGQRLLLEVVREAFESAGERDFRGKNIGSYVGIYAQDWQDLQNMDANDSSPYGLTGKLDFMIANRLAYEYDLRGPSVTMKTACSSSAMALHQALQAIQVGEISSAIVAGANLILTPGLSIAMSATGMLSPDGSCKTFDAAADGYARAEAVSCLYVKRLDHAIRDGNPIRAVIRASGSNADGRSPGGLTNPNAAAHESLIRQTYQNAGLSFDDTAMVECHGTGTAVGDPLEAIAVGNCFGSRGVYIGSIKPNLGHSEAAAGIVSILKAVVSLESQTILPNIKFDTPNPASKCDKAGLQGGWQTLLLFTQNEEPSPGSFINNIFLLVPWKRAKLMVPTETLPWPTDRRERISINSIGVGGSNVHASLLQSPFQIPPANP